MSNAATTMKAPVLESARLLRELHALFAQGKEESEEADAIRDEMENSWYAMKPHEREQMRGLSADLYSLTEGGPPRVAMNGKDLQAWQTEARKLKEKFDNGDMDALLSLLRKPMPDRIPAGVIHFLQAHCWEKLGDHATAALFLKAAAKYDTHLTASDERQLQLLDALIAA